MRAFLSIDICQGIRDSYAFLCRQGRECYPGLRWVPPENLHLTLRFLGEIKDELVSELQVRIRDEIAGISPFEISLGEPGSFGPASRPRILWFGIENGAAELEMLARRIERAVRGVGFAKEARPWRGHLTVARNPRGVRLEAWRDMAMDCKLAGLSQNVENVTLQSSSVTGRRGQSPVYSPLWRLGLTAR